MVIPELSLSHLVVAAVVFFVMKYFNLAGPSGQLDLTKLFDLFDKLLHATPPEPKPQDKALVEEIKKVINKGA